MGAPENDTHGDRQCNLTKRIRLQDNSTRFAPRCALRKLPSLAGELQARGNLQLEEAGDPLGIPPSRTSSAWFVSGA